MFNLKDRNNLTKEERDSISNLRNNKNIVIQSADKGGATVIMNRENYILEAERQLNNNKYYRRLDKPIYMDNISKIKKIVSEMLLNKFITNDQFDYLTGPAEVRQRIFYLLPKIHKKREVWPQANLMPEGRPIVSDVNSETYRISEFIDYYLNPLGAKHESYLKNTYDFVNKIRNFAVDNNYLLVTGDITSLYTNMNIDRSLDCVKKIFAENKDEKRPDDSILQLLEISLKNNDFQFNDKNYLQIMGTAMGKRFAPALANIYLLEFDKIASNNYLIKPMLFFRYLDDIFFLWPGDVNSLKDYESFLNNIIPDIKVTLEFDLNHINFLDTTVYKFNNTLQTKIYFKPTDTHQLLHKDSFHPRHTFMGILKSQFIRYKRICSNKSDYDNTCKILFASLIKRGYKHREMRTCKNEVWFNYQESTNDNKERVESNGSLLPIVLDYSSIGQKLGRNLKNVLINDTITKDLRVVVAFKNSKNLKQMLVRSQLESNKRGKFVRCGQNNCKACKSHTVDSSIVKSTFFKKDFEIKDTISCTSENIIYCITCRVCQLQYVGETSRSLRERLNDHRSSIKLKKKTPIAQHFNSPNHSILDLKIIGIELCKNNSHISRQHREQHWQKTLGTFFPKGLNGSMTF